MQTLGQSEFGERREERVGEQLRIVTTFASLDFQDGFGRGR